MASDASAHVADSQSGIDVVVTATEVNHQHGTGPLVQRLYQGRRGVFSIRSRDQWGHQDFGDWNIQLSHEGLTREESSRRVRDALAGHTVRSVLCIPYFSDELVTSLVIDARMCGYIMDDQNVAQAGIPNDLMREFLEKCSLRFATHPELRDAYQDKYGLPFSLLPAVVPDSLIAREPVPPVCDARRGALLGSFWDQSWIDRLCEALDGCDCRVDWYGNNANRYLRFSEGEFARAGITALGVVPEEQTARELRRYPFVIVPVGALDGRESNTGVAQLSLPGRILFAAATSQTPVLVVGSEKTCAARFVARFGIGLTAWYDTASLRSAIERMNDPAEQIRMRKNAAAIGPRLSDRGIVEWLARSIELGRPADDRFEFLS